MRTEALLTAAKRTACALVVTILAHGLASAKTVTVAWDPNPPEENVTGYVVHYGTSSRATPGFTAYDSQVDAGNVTQQDLDLPDSTATYYIAVTAYNGQGLNSDYSAEITSVPEGPTFLIVADALGSGTITPSGNITLAQGIDQTFTVAADPGANIDDVTVDGTSVGAVSSYTFSNVTANHTINATFEGSSYSVSATAGHGGTVTPSGTISVASGETVVFTITADATYHVADVLLDGASVGAVESYTLSNVDREHTLEVVFDKDRPSGPKSLRVIRVVVGKK